MLKHLKTYIKRFMIIATVMVCTLPLSGCEGLSIPVTARDNLYSALNLRVTANINIANELYKAGLINQTTLENVTNSMNTIYNNIVDKLNSDDANTAADGLMALVAGVVDWREVPPTGIHGPNGEHTGVDCCYPQINANFILDCVASQARGELKKAAFVDTVDGTIQPIELIDPSAATEIQKAMNYPIYVLNPEASLDEVYAFLNKYATENSVTDEFFQHSSKYFHELKDADGNTVTLLDPEDEESQIVTTSKSPGVTWVDNESQKVTTGMALGEKDTLDSGASRLNTPGTDLVVYQHSTFPVMRVRFREFNQEAFEKIRNQLGLGEQKYLVTTTESGGRVYLLQYPVGYIDGFDLSEDGQNYEASIAKSNLEINIKTGKLYKVSESGNMTDYTGRIANESEVDSEDPYISLSGGSPDTSSFTIHGETGVDDDPTSGAWNLEFGDKGVKASIPRIVLRDYLEISYSPNVTPGETFVAFGRKIRILHFSGPLNQEVAKICNKDGTVLEGAMSFDINNFADYSALAGTGGETTLPYVKYIPNSTAEGVSTEEDETNFCAELSTIPNYETDKVEMLRGIARDSIQCGVPFPGDIVAKGDKNLKDAKPLFYGLIVSKNYQESGLLNWIASESDTESTSWWNLWLKSHDFTYQIGTQEVLNYLKENYTYELGQAGYVMLDLDTLSKLQEELDAEAQAGQTHTLRTFFKVLGYVLVGYAFILMMCWVADTSVDLGLNLTQKVSFGRLVAVAGDEELRGSEENNHVSYVGFQSMLLSCFKIIVIGLLLILVDIVSIVSFLTQTLGRIAVSIGEMIGG